MYVDASVRRAEKDGASRDGKYLIKTYYVANSRDGLGVWECWLWLDREVLGGEGQSCGSGGKGSDGGGGWKRRWMGEYHGHCVAGTEI